MNSSQIDDGSTGGQLTLPEIVSNRSSVTINNKPPIGKERTTFHNMPSKQYLKKGTGIQR